MNKKLAFQIASPVMIALILIALVLLQANRIFNTPLTLDNLTIRSEKISAPLAGPALTNPLTKYDAGEASAYRWRAMADFYEKNGMLRRDPFDYEQAADNLALRWQAMAEFYKEHGLLTRAEPQAAPNKPLTEYDAGEASAYRWQAMARFYDEQGLLNERSTAK